MSISTVQTVEPTYTERLEQIGITLLEDYTMSQKPHSMQCHFCNHIWTATPLAKLQSYRKHQTNGCPNCKKLKINQSFEHSRQRIIDVLVNRHITILSDDYNGHQLSNVMIHVRNEDCGHDFWITPTNLIHRNVICSICRGNVLFSQLHHDGE